MVHPVAAKGFGDQASNYEATRPSYPISVVEWFAGRLPLGPGDRVADLAAGTGKFTRLLVPLGAAVVAVEPVTAMRDTLRAAVPGVAAVAGVAEALPFAEASLDAVTVAQAFHWFDSAATVAELARVVRPGGGVGLVWNVRERDADWVARVWSIMDRVERNAPWRDHDRWRDTAEADWPGFERPEVATFHHDQVLSPEGVVARIASVSHVATLEPVEQAAVLDEVREVIAEHPETRGLDLLRIPYRVDAYAARRTA